MKKFNITGKTLKWALPLLVIGGAFVVSSIIKNSRPETPVNTVEKSLPSVWVIVAQKTSFQPIIQAQGTVRAKRQIELVPEVSGKIIQVSPVFAEGGFFKAGEILLEIDPRDYEFAVSRSRATVADARNTLALEQAEADQAENEWRALGQGKEATALVLREPQMARARAKLSSAQADLDQALLDLERTRITAPFEGRIEEKKVDIGQYVSPGNPLAVIYSTDVAEISLPITDRQLGKINLKSTYFEEKIENSTLDVRLTANVGGKAREWFGKIVRTAGTVDQESRVLNIIVEVANPYAIAKGGAPLLNGLFVEAEIPGIEFQDVYEMPRAALYNQTQVVVVDAQARLRSRDVEILHSTANKVILRGLKDGERVNITPLEILIEGTKVDWKEGTK